MPSTWIETVHLIRHEKSWTLARLAEVAGCSLSVFQNRLKNEVPPAMKVTIEEVLDFTYDFNSKHLLQLELEHYLIMFLYGDYEAAYEKTTELLERRLEYQNSSLYLDYWVHLYACTMHTKDERIDAVHIQQKLQSLLPLKDAFLHELYEVESITYAYLMSHKAAMLALPEGHYDTRQDARLKALNMYIVGAYYSQRYTRLYQGIELLKQALLLFETQANYVRSNQTKVVLQEAYLWAKDFEAYRMLYQQSIQYIQLTQNRRLEQIMNETVIQFQLTQGEYKDALSIALPHVERHYQNVFVILFCAVMTDSESLHQATVGRIDKTTLSIMHPYYTVAFDWFKSYAFTPHVYSKESLRVLKRLWELALDEEYYYLIAISARWLIQFYTQLRRYKDAQSIAHQWQRVEATIV